VASFSRCPSSRARDNLHILPTANDRVVLEVAGAKKHSAVRGVDESRGVIAALAETIGVRRALTGYDDAAGAMLHSGARDFNAHAILCSFKLFGLNCGVLDGSDDCDQIHCAILPPCRIAVRTRDSVNRPARASAPLNRIT
jgi:hypothetical protein